MASARVLFVFMFTCDRPRTRTRTPHRVCVPVLFVPCTTRRHLDSATRCSHSTGIVLASRSPADTPVRPS
jgi:hypothetical protein